MIFGFLSGFVITEHISSISEGVQNEQENSLPFINTMHGERQIQIDIKRQKSDYLRHCSVLYDQFCVLLIKDTDSRLTNKNLKQNLDCLN